MHCIEAILTRRSIRRYRSEPLSDDVLTRILEAGLFAPSAVNLQPWYLVVVRSREQMKRLLQGMEQTAAGVEFSLRERFRRAPQVAEEALGFIRCLGGAPVCVLAFQHKPEYPKQETSIVQSVAAAIENMLLAAWSLGVGSCWLTAPLEAGVSEQLCQVFAPGHGKLVAMVTLGNPEGVQTAPKRKDARWTIL